MNNRKQFKTITNVCLKNRLSNEIVICDIINEDVIEGKLYFVVRQHGRVLKYAKDSYFQVKNK